MAPRNPNTPIPLTRWIRGTVRVHFRDGLVTNHDVSLYGAHSIRFQVDDAQGGESIDGVESHQGWIAARSDEIVLTEWTPDPEYGWRDTAPEDRRRMRDLGMKHGVLGALAELWADKGGSPAYSVNAVSALFGLATKDVVTRDEWDEIAEMLEGDDGATFMSQVLAGLTKKSQTGRAASDDLIDDGAEPEPERMDDAQDREQTTDEGQEASETSVRPAADDDKDGGSENGQHADPTAR